MINEKQSYCKYNMIWDRMTVLMMVHGIKLFVGTSLVRFDICRFNFNIGMNRVMNQEWSLLMIEFLLLYSRE